MKMPTANLVLLVESAKADGALPYWAVRWHEGDQYPKRRLGPAWLAPVGSKDAKPNGRTFGQRRQWVERKGRVREGALDERDAMELAKKEQREWADRLATEVAERERVTRSFRALAREWQGYMVKIGKHKPSTAYDVACTLVEPGVMYKRRKGESHGIVMRLLGDTAAHQVTQADIEEVFDEYEELGRSGRTINKVREQLRAIFNYGCDPRRGWHLDGNPVVLTDPRRVNGAGGVKYFEIEQVEAVAAIAAGGLWRAETRAAYDRDPLTVEQGQEENDQLAELIRFAAYTGLRQGELVVLQWSDVNLRERTATVERALSGTVITAPKSGKMRVVPLGAPALAALKRLRKRPNFTSPDDYVFATLAGDRPDPSALRRRYNQARDKSGAPALTFHGLRHTAASLFIRKMDPREVQAIMGHASIKTTERYLHARRASDLVDKATDALTPEPLSEQEKLREQLLALDAEARDRLLEQIGVVVG
jgi:integrase